MTFTQIALYAGGAGFFLILFCTALVVVLAFHEFRVLPRLLDWLDGKEHKKGPTIHE